MYVLWSDGHASAIKLNTFLLLCGICLAVFTMSARKSYAGVDGIEYLREYNHENYPAAEVAHQIACLGLNLHAVQYAIKNSERFAGLITSKLGDKSLVKLLVQQEFDEPLDEEVGNLNSVHMALYLAGAPFDRVMKMTRTGHSLCCDARKVVMTMYESYRTAANNVEPEHLHTITTKILSMFEYLVSHIASRPHMIVQLMDTIDFVVRMNDSDLLQYQVQHLNSRCALLEDANARLVTEIEKLRSEKSAILNKMPSMNVEQCDVVHYPDVDVDSETSDDVDSETSDDDIGDSETSDYVEVSAESDPEHKDEPDCQCNADICALTRAVVAKDSETQISIINRTIAGVNITFFMSVIRNLHKLKIPESDIDAFVSLFINDFVFEDSISTVMNDFQRIEDEKIADIYISQPVKLWRPMIQRLVALDKMDTIIQILMFVNNMNQDEVYRITLRTMILNTLTESNKPSLILGVISKMITDIA